MNNTLELITSTKEYTPIEYTILLLVKFTCLTIWFCIGLTGIWSIVSTLGFYGGITGICNAVSGVWKKCCALKTPIKKEGEIDSYNEEVHDKCDEENKQSFRTRTSTTKRKLRTSTSLVFCILFVISSVCESKKGPLEGKFIVGYCYGDDKNCHDIHASGLDLTMCESNGDCDLSLLPNHPSCKPPMPGKTFDFNFGDGKTFCQDSGKIYYCAINHIRPLFPTNWKLEFSPVTKNRFKLERQSYFLREKGIKVKTFSFESSLVFEKNNNGTCKRSIIVSALPTDEMNKYYAEYRKKKVRKRFIFSFFKAVFILVIFILLCG